MSASRQAAADKGVRRETLKRPSVYHKMGTNTLISFDDSATGTIVEP
jgi:hypothetical protein